jgi:hypothetical protein
MAGYLVLKKGDEEVGSSASGHAVGRGRFTRLKAPTVTAGWTPTAGLGDVGNPTRNPRSSIP